MTSTVLSRLPRFRPALLCAAFSALLLGFSRAENSLAPRQVAQLTTIGIDGSDPRVVFQTSDIIEAPNWTSDGKWLVFNSKGSLWRVAADGSDKPEKIAAGDVQD